MTQSPDVEPTVSHNPHIPCDLQGGHLWGEPIPGKNVNDAKITLVVCKNCGKVQA